MSANFRKDDKFKKYRRPPKELRKVLDSASSYIRGVMAKESVDLNHATLIAMFRSMVAEQGMVGEVQATALRAYISAWVEMTGQGVVVFDDSILEDGS